MAILLNNNAYITPIGNRNITPGQNIIPEEEMATLLKNTFVKEQVALKHWSIESSGVKIEFDEDEKVLPESPEQVIERAIAELCAMDTKKAVKVIVGDEGINGILDVQVLEALQKVDTRRGIQRAIEAQLNFLMAQPEKED